MTDEQILELAFKHCYASTAAGGFIFDRERGHMLKFARAASPQPVEQTERALTDASIEATSALIANSLLGAAPEEDVREVERLINEMLGRT